MGKPSLTFDSSLNPKQKKRIRFEAQMQTQAQQLTIKTWEEHGGDALFKVADGKNSSAIKPSIIKKVEIIS